MATNIVKRVAEHIDRHRRHGMQRQLRLQVNPTGQFWEARWVVVKDESTEWAATGLTAEESVLALLRTLDEEWQLAQSMAVRS